MVLGHIGIGLPDLVDAAAVVAPQLLDLGRKNIQGIAVLLSVFNSIYQPPRPFSLMAASKMTFIGISLFLESL